MEREDFDSVDLEGHAVSRPPPAEDDVPAENDDAGQPADTTAAAPDDQAGMTGQFERPRTSHAWWWVAGIAACVVVAAIAAGWIWVAGRKVWTDDRDLEVPTADARIRRVLWTPPRAMSEVFNTPKQEYEVCLSPDANELYFVRGMPGKGADLYTSSREGDGWTEPVPVTSVNTKHDELGPRLSRDGQVLLFYSNRPGGLGGYDIWAAARTEDGWAAPVNLGTGVNSKHNEYGPAMNGDGTRLFFASNRKAAERYGQKVRWRATIREGEIGDYDLFVADLVRTATQPATAPATQPKRLPGEGPVPPFRAEPAVEVEGVNTRWHEGAPCVSSAGDFLYFVSNRPGGFGAFDLYRCRISTGAAGEATNLGVEVNTPANETDPQLAYDGFRMYFSSDRASEEGNYDLYVSESREVYARRQRRDLPQFGWGLWALLAALALLIPLLLFLKAGGYRHLSTLQKCAVLSLLLHVLMTLMFSLAKISQEIMEYIAPEAGLEVAVNLNVSSQVAVSSQIRHQITELAVQDPRMAFLERARPVVRQARAAQPVAANVPRAELRPVVRTIQAVSPSPAEVPPAATDQFLLPAPLVEAPQPRIQVAPPPAAVHSDEARVRVKVRQPDAIAKAGAEAITPPARARPEVLPLQAAAPAAQSLVAPAKPVRATVETVSDTAVRVPTPQLVRTQVDPIAPVTDVAPVKAAPPPTRAIVEKPGPVARRRSAGPAVTQDQAPQPVEADVPGARIQPVARAIRAVAPSPPELPAASADRVRLPALVVQAPQPEIELAGASAALRGDETRVRADVRRPDLIVRSSSEPPSPSAKARPAAVSLRVAAPAMRSLVAAVEPVRAAVETPREAPAPVPVPAPQVVAMQMDLAGPKTPVSPVKAAPPPTAVVVEKPGRVAREQTAGPVFKPGKAVVAIPIVQAAGDSLATAVSVADAPPQAAPVNVSINIPTLTHQPRVVPPTLGGPVEQASEAPVLASAVDAPSAMKARAVSAPSPQRAKEPIRVSHERHTAEGADAASTVRKDPADLPARVAVNIRLAAADPQVDVPALSGPLGPTKLASPRSLFQRSFEQRQRLLKEMGGSKKSEAAVARALVYLSRRQENDGRWTYLTGRAGRGSRRRRGTSDIALTSLSALCFLAADHTPAKEGPYRRTIARSLDFLIKQQKKDGSLWEGGGRMYGHAIATLALGEAAIMTGEERYRRAAVKGARYLLKAQHGEGGWRYSPAERGDTSVFGWVVMALHSVEQLGVKIPDKTRDGAMRFLRHVRGGKTGILAGYQSGSPKPAMSAEAAFSRILLGQKLSDSQQNELADYLGSSVLKLKQKHNFYCVYYASLAMMQLGGKAWENWNPKMQKYLTQLQKRGGDDDGAWDLKTQYSGHHAGKIYTTAMATLSLEVYYRYLPMLRATGGK